MSDRPTRRRFLAAAAAGTTALAGCNALPGGTGGETRTYDRGAVAGLADRPAPTPPSTIPVTVPPSMIDTHRERARELLDGVPADPAIPNEAVADQVREQRQRVASALDEDEPEGDLDRLAEWRERRAAAADLWWTCEAATGDVEPADVRTQRENLRTNLARFRGVWSHRGTDHWSALHLHRYVERRLDRARRGTVPWPRVPAASVDDPRLVGRAAEKFERGLAALVDAAELRSQYLDGNDVAAYRDAFGAATISLGQQRNRRDDAVETLVDEGRTALDRDVEGTPAAELFDRARRTARATDHPELNDHERDQRYATGVIAGGRSLAAADAMADAVAAIRDGEYDDDARSVDEIESLQEDAASALDAAWNADPRDLSVALAEPALDAVRSAAWQLDQEPTSGHALDEVTGKYAFAVAYAEAVPSAAAAVRRTVEWADH